jgi:hypothetical protein
LHELIRAMKQDIPSPDDLDYTDCLSEDLRNCIFYLGLEDSYGFLLATFNALQTQQ